MPAKKVEIREITLDRTFGLKHDDYGFILIERHRGRPDHNRYYQTFDMALKRYIELKLLNKPEKKMTIIEYLSEFHKEVDRIEKIEFSF